MKPEKKGKEKKGKKKHVKGGKTEEESAAEMEEVTATEVSTPEKENYGGEEMYGEYEYSSGENTEAEESYPEPQAIASTDSLTHEPKKYDYQFPWSGAADQMTPLSHSFRVTLPSGLFFQVDDVPGPPLMREVKQCYLAKSEV